MPAGDITHPMPDLTGYITEGQLVLSPELHARGVYPPVDPLQSLSRLMRKGAGPGRTRDDHLDVAAQLLAALARARQVRELADLVGPETLSGTDQQYLAYETAFGEHLLDQGRAENRTLDRTLDLAWKVLGELPRRELTMLPLAHGRGARLLGQRSREGTLMTSTCAGSRPDAPGGCGCPGGCRGDPRRGPARAEAAHPAGRGAGLLPAGGAHGGGVGPGGELDRWMLQSALLSGERGLRLARDAGTSTSTSNGG